MNVAVEPAAAILLDGRGPPVLNFVPALHRRRIQEVFRGGTVENHEGAENGDASVDKAALGVAEGILLETAVQIVIERAGLEIGCVALRVERHLVDVLQGYEEGPSVLLVDYDPSYGPAGDRGILVGRQVFRIGPELKKVLALGFGTRFAWHQRLDFGMPDGIRFETGKLLPARESRVTRVGRPEHPKQRPVGPTFKPNSKMCISGFAAIQVSTVTITPQRA